MKIQFLLIVLFCIVISNHSFSQSKGYIITLKNDTIHGLFKKSNFKNCEFKGADSNKYKKYSPASIKSYKTHKKYFISERIFLKDEFRNVFLKVLIESDSISLYYHPKNKKQMFYIKLNDDDLLGLYNEEKEIVFHTNNSTSAKITHASEYFAKYDYYRFTLLKAFPYCSNAFLKRLMELEYDKELIKGIIMDYLLVVCENNKCISYEE